jgi:hypothetical protein
MPDSEGQNPDKQSSGETEDSNSVADKALQEQQPEPQAEEPTPRTPRRRRTPRVDNDHGSSTMRVYPVTESSMNSLQVNSQNSSLQYSIANSLISVAVTIIVSYCFTSSPTPTMNAFVLIGPIVCVLGAVVQYYSGWKSSKTTTDEWVKIQRNTKFQTIELEP